MEQHKELASFNYRISPSTSGTSRYKQYNNYHSDDQSDEINLSLTLGIDIGSRPKIETTVNDNKSNAAAVPWLYQAFS
jgi:hypothetical protein